jgi:hypothetical protein
VTPVTSGTFDDDIAPAPREPPQALSVLLAIMAAGCLIAACFSHHWLANRRVADLGYSPRSFQDAARHRGDAARHRGDEERRVADLGYSPLSFQICMPSCTTISNFQVAESADDLPFEEDRVSRAFPIAGLLTFVVLLIAAGGLLVAAGIAAANKRPNLPVSPTTFALLGLMIGLVTGCVFVATKPGEVGAVGVSWGFWAFGIGSVVGITGALLLARQIRPSDPDLLHDAMNPDQF